MSEETFEEKLKKLEANLKAAGDKEEKALINNEIGRLYFKGRSLKKAAQYFEASLDTDDDAVKTSARANLSLIHYKHAQGTFSGIDGDDSFEKAENYYHQAYEGLNDSNKCVLNNARAGACSSIGKHLTARDCYLANVKDDKGEFVSVSDDAELNYVRAASFVKLAESELDLKTEPAENRTYFFTCLEKAAEFAVAVEDEQLLQGINSLQKQINEELDEKLSLTGNVTAGVESARRKVSLIENGGPQVKPFAQLSTSQMTNMMRSCQEF